MSGHPVNVMLRENRTPVPLSLEVISGAYSPPNLGFEPGISKCKVFVTSALWPVAHDSQNDLAKVVHLPSARIVNRTR